MEDVLEKLKYVRLCEGIAVVQFLREICMCSLMCVCASVNIGENNL